MTGVLLHAALPSAFAMEPRLQASLITCRPGPEIYELFGHEALRIRGIDENGEVVDSIWNYGVFDFASPGFVPRFVKGETDYLLYPCPTSLFVESYNQRGSGVVEQDILLTPEETLRLRKLLQINALPANRTYRYNYVRDNCSTRVADIVDSALVGRKVVYPDTVSYPTYRAAMRSFHKDYPWYQFGIDLVLGSGLDVPITSRQELFAPLLMEQKSAEAHFSDGQPFVAPAVIVTPGDSQGNSYGDGTYDSALPATPWWMSPLFVCSAIFVLSLSIAFWQWKKRRLLKLCYAIFFGILGIAGCLVWFLVFVSTHEATSPNLLALWLNPLQILIAIFIWWRSTRMIAVAMSVVDIIVLLLLSLAWPMQQQVTNPAVFPLWGATLALTLSFVGVYAKKRNIYRPYNISNESPVKKKQKAKKSTARRKKN